MNNHTGEVCEFCEKWEENCKCDKEIRRLLRELRVSHALTRDLQQQLILRGLNERYFKHDEP